jgi:hypothetical protein
VKKSKVSKREKVKNGGKMEKVKKKKTASPPLKEKIILANL